MRDYRDREVCLQLQDRFGGNTSAVEDKPKRKTFRNRPCREEMRGAYILRLRLKDEET